MFYVLNPHFLDTSSFEHSDRIIKSYISGKLLEWGSKLEEAAVVLNTSVACEGYRSIRGGGREEQSGKTWSGRKFIYSCGDSLFNLFIFKTY